MMKIITTSWDDGHKLDLKLATLLKKYNLAATFYIAPSQPGFDRKDLLSEQEIQFLSESFEIGGHTLHHPNLTQVPLNIAVDEIKAGRDWLESITGKKIRSFAYPYGAYTEPVQKAVLDLGFVVARTAERFSIKSPTDYSALPTTVHLVNYKRDIKKFPKYRTIKWQNLARYFFDQTLKKGGVFHLWGHSWEVEKYNQWKNLEAIFEYISDREDVAYVSNGNLYKRFGELVPEEGVVQV
ncbi:MAG TPA: polysaccharide deacetylase family protein [Ktedonobacteraceae bacterium]|nr:polysaccharide deacetylase family protein [Ktedonobacteraceae bacterium]